jgi:hypothetical protein
VTKICPQLSGKGDTIHFNWLSGAEEWNGILDIPPYKKCPRCNNQMELNKKMTSNVFAVYQNGEVRARKTTVDLQHIPDYVFKEDYKLMELKELETFITKNKHLPNIKSEAEYQKEGGIDLGELNIKLLEKVEELTLYTIQQQKQIDALKKMVELILKK